MAAVPGVVVPDLSTERNQENHQHRKRLHTPEHNLSEPHSQSGPQQPNLLQPRWVS